MAATPHDRQDGRPGEKQPTQLCQARIGRPGQMGLSRDRQPAPVGSTAAQYGGARDPRIPLVSAEALARWLPDPIWVSEGGSDMASPTRSALPGSPCPFTSPGTGSLCVPGEAAARAAASISVARHRLPVRGCSLRPRPA